MRDYAGIMIKNGSTIYTRYFKRILDVVFASIALLILSPVIGTIALAIKIDMGSPILFKQARPGKGEKIFYLYKFKSMINAMDENGMLLPDSKRVSRFGRFLRTSSLDELPELVNIIKGDMSIVGPRPLSIYYLPHYSKENRIRHDVRPGLTGLAQVKGRNDLDWDKRFALDVQYVRNISFLGDIKIILQTVKKVLMSEGVTLRGVNTVKDFGPYSIIKEEGTVQKKMLGMTYSEIGSYFWLDEPKANATAQRPLWLPDVADAAFTFSGRAAIELALRDILCQRKVKKAYVPSYCCISMLQPFIDNGLELQYYDVLFSDGAFQYAINADHDCDIVLIMNYFGIGIDQTHEAIERLHDGRAIIIEDITHSLLNSEAISPCCDYFVASLRKWFAIPAGGWFGKAQGWLSVKPDFSSDHAVKEKINGMKEKAAYISGDITDKEHFLLVNAKFENDLIHNDRMLMIDNMSYHIICDTDIEQVRRQRRLNAATLLSGLSSLNGSIFILPDLNLDNDVPLFVPVVLEEKKRDELRQYLIEHSIYCPIHWPEIMGAPVGIRANELSLICDQRYSENDMQAIIDCIKEWAMKRGIIEKDISTIYGG